LHGSLGRITNNGGIEKIPSFDDVGKSDEDALDADTRETYAGEWKGDKRSGFGISIRSDGLQYVGEWYNDKKCGYGVTTFQDGTKEEGKYKDNYLINITSGSTSKIFSLHRSRPKDKVEAAVVASRRVENVAKEKSEIAMTR